MMQTEKFETWIYFHLPGFEFKTKVLHLINSETQMFDYFQNTNRTN